MVPENCEAEVIDLLLEMQQRASRYDGDPEAGFNAEQNALVIKNAEKYYRQVRGHRAIGVVYHPESESRGNYVPTILPRRYDAFLYIDETQALHPLSIDLEEINPPDLYPWGV